jgi:predicted transcriptional regulator of viral defense system
LLELDRKESAKMLSKLASKGWVRRLRRGVYLLIPLEATSPEDWRADPWVVADHVFQPAYIAGWSACEHWGFTEQIFRDVAVFTSAPIRERRVTIDQTDFVLKKILEHLFFGTQSVWRGNTRVKVSDPTRTLVDILDDPQWGGGMRHVVQITQAYLDSNHRDDDLLVEYIERIGNSSPAKRLGYILETRHKDNKGLIEKLEPLLNTGYVLLDPSIPARGSYVSKWNVRVNVELAQ